MTHSTQPRIDRFMGVEVIGRHVYARDTRITRAHLDDLFTWAELPCPDGDTLYLSWHPRSESFTCWSR